MLLLLLRQQKKKKIPPLPTPWVSHRPSQFVARRIAHSSLLHLLHPLLAIYSVPCLEGGQDGRIDRRRLTPPAARVITSTDSVCAVRVDGEELFFFTLNERPDDDSPMRRVQVVHIVQPKVQRAFLLPSSIIAGRAPGRGGSRTVYILFLSLIHLLHIRPSATAAAAQ